jgi:hypothetical protein
MRLASPQELQTEATPALRIHLPEKELSRLFPVRMKTLDPLNEPEPSKGALVQLSSDARTRNSFAPLAFQSRRESLR